MAAWDADHYLQFGDERTRPSVDLVSRIDVHVPETVIDLGCGPGNSTQVVRHRWPHARVLGLDSSPEMIAAARESYPEQAWILESAENWSPEAPYDVVFSNAALQWLPSHETLVRNLFDQVAPGGALAFQIPCRTYSLLTGLIDEIADDATWSARMEGPRSALTMEAASFYYDSLADRAQALDIWETEYHHVMASPGSIVDWISSTGLRPYLAVLATDAERRRFREMLTERVTRSYPRRRDGNVLFPFRRLFVVAYTHT
jgi:trans-aconitate 2-methyltransferase